MRQSTTWFGLMAFALVASVSLSACQSSGDQPPGRVLTLYNGQHEQTTDALVQAFTKTTGIQVKVRSDDEDVLGNQIAQEGSATPADVFYSENSQALEFLQGRGLLAPVSRSTLTRVASRYDSPNGQWVGVSARVSVMVYNTSRLRRSQLPTSALDLANARWKGLLGIAPGETDFEPIITSIARRYGSAAAEQWLAGLKDNAGSHRYPDNETLTSMVNSGQVAIGIINHYYWYRLRAETGAHGMHSAIAFFAPRDPGYVLDVSGAAVLKGSRNRTAAERLLAFMVSRRGQEIIAHGESFEYPLGSGVKTAESIPRFRSLRPENISLSQLRDGEAAVRLLQRAQLF